MPAERIYNYTIEGTAADGQTWSVTGEVRKSGFSDILDVFDHVMAECFFKLTNGDAVYGSPGKGCSGPYTIERVVIERVKE